MVFKRSTAINQEVEVEAPSHIDGLTGLPDRWQVEVWISEHLSRSQRTGDRFGFFLVSPDAGRIVSPGGSQGVLCLTGFQIGRYNGNVQNSGANGEVQLGIDTGDFLDKRGTLTWRGDSYTAKLNVQGYERATVTDITPYERLPQVTLNGVLPFQPGGLNFAYNTELVRFDRDLRSGFFTDRDGNTGTEDQRWYDDRSEDVV